MSLKQTDSNLSNLNGLTRLSLANVSLNNISRLNFEHFTNVEQLDLSFNQISFISQPFFLNVKKVKYLSLKNNNLTDSAFLTVLPNLEVIDLSENRCDFKKLEQAAIMFIIRNTGLTNLNDLVNGNLDIFIRIQYFDVSSNKLEQ